MTVPPSKAGSQIPLRKGPGNTRRAVYVPLCQCVDVRPGVKPRGGKGLAKTGGRPGNQPRTTHRSPTRGGTRRDRVTGSLRLAPWRLNTQTQTDTRPTRNMTPSLVVISRPGTVCNFTVCNFPARHSPSHQDGLQNQKWALAETIWQWAAAAATRRKNSGSCDTSSGHRWGHQDGRHLRRGHQFGCNFFF